jgi:hypothetical protein
VLQGWSSTAYEVGAGGLVVTREKVKGTETKDAKTREGVEKSAAVHTEGENRDFSLLQADEDLRMSH